MDKNSLIGILVITGILIGWSVWMKPDQDETEAYQRKIDSLRLAEEQAAVREDTFIYEDTQEQQSEEERTFVAEDKDIQEQQETLGNEELQKRYGPFAGAAIENDTLYHIENDLLEIAVSARGGRVYYVKLKEFVKHDSSDLILFDGDDNRFGFNFFAGNRLISTNELFFSFEDLKVEADTQMLTLRLWGGEDEYIEYTYKVAPNSYMVGFDIKLHNIHTYMGNNNSIEIDWEIALPQLERGVKNENLYTSVYYKYFQDDVDYLSSRSNSDQQEELMTKVKWIAFKHQFFSSVLIAGDAFDRATVSTVNLEEEENGYLKKCLARMVFPINLQPEEIIELQYYFGPNHFQTLQSYGMELQELVSLGQWIIKWINQYVIIPIFNWLDNYMGNYGLIILLLTLIIKTALFPLTYRSYLSTAKMRALKPKVDELKSKYPKAKQMEAQQATMALYKKVGVSPLGGCLPMLLQMPILIAMYRFFPTSIELRQEAFLWTTDLSTYDSILNLPFTIPFYGDHVSLFTLLMTVTTILSMKLNSQPAAYDQPGMKTMMYIMPVMFLFIFNSFASGLTFYLFVANVITIGQNTIFNYYIDDQALLAKLEAAGKKKGPQKKSKFQERLEKVAKEQSEKKKKR